MNRNRPNLRRLFLLGWSLSLGACAAAVPGASPVGTSPDGGVVATPSEFFGATGEKASTGDGDEKTYDGDAGGIAPPSSDNATALPLGTSEGMSAYNPISGFPAPTHDFPVLVAGIEGKSSVCRVSGDTLLLTLEGFVKKPLDNYSKFYKDCGNEYAVSIYNKDDKKTFETNLQTMTEAHEYEGIERTGFLRVSLPISAASYPKAVYELKFNLIPAKAHISTTNVMIAGGDIFPWALLQNLPQDPAKIALCPPPPTLTKDVMTLTE